MSTISSTSTAESIPQSKFDVETTANVIDNGLLKFFKESEYMNKNLKISFKRDTVDPSQFVVEAYVEELNEKKKRQKVRLF